MRMDVADERPEPTLARASLRVSAFIRGATFPPRYGSSSATASAAMPSRRPAKPRWSVVVAFTLT